MTDEVKKLLAEIEGLKNEVFSHKLALHGAAGLRQDHAAQMVAAEREACARLVESMGLPTFQLLNHEQVYGAHQVLPIARKMIAAAIRARGVA